MEQVDEETAQESSCGCPRQVGRVGAQLGQMPREPRKWPQGWHGQKPQEDCCGPAQRTTSAPWPQEVIEIVIASIRARFGDGAIGLGDSGIRFAAREPHAHTA
jgi:hypothetical protein